MTESGSTKNYRIITTEIFSTSKSSNKKLNAKRQPCLSYLAVEEVGNERRTSRHFFWHENNNIIYPHPAILQVFLYSLHSSQESFGENSPRMCRTQEGILSGYLRYI